MMNNGPAYAPHQPEKKSSTGKILLGLGLGCGGLVLLVILVAVALVWSGYNKIANSEGVQAASAYVANSTDVQAEIGSPITTSFAGGNVNINNGTGDAVVQLKATGPKGTGPAEVILHCTNNGPWSVVSAKFTRPDGIVIDVTE